LARCIQKLKNEDPVLSGAAVEAAASDFITWLEERKKELRIAAHESGRWPSGCEAWCEKNLPNEFREVGLTFFAAIDRPSKGSIQNLRSAYEEMLHKYVNAVQ
jgi:hypothetical protein